MTAAAHAVNSVLGALATEKFAVSAYSTQSRGQSQNQIRCQSQSRLVAAPLQACRTSSSCSASYQLSKSFQVAGAACCQVSSTGLFRESPAYSGRVTGRGGAFCSAWAGLGTSESGRRKENAQRKPCSPACGALHLAHRSPEQEPLHADAGSNRWHASSRSSTGGTSSWSRSWMGKGRTPFTHASHRQGGLTGFLSHCSVPCQKAGAPWLGLRTGGMASAPAVAWHGRPLGHSDKKVGGASGRGDAPAVRLQCFAKKSSKSDWEKEVDKWRSTTSDWEKEVDKWRSRSNRWQGRRFRGGGRKGGGGGLRGRRGRSLGGLGMAAGAIAGLAALTAGAAALTAGVAVASTAVLFPLVIPLVLGTGAVIFAGAVASLAAGLALVVPLVALSFAFLGPFGGLFRLLLPLPLPFGAIGPAVDKLFCFVIVANFLGALGGAYTRSRSAAAPGGAGSGRPLSRGQEAAALLLDMQPLAPGVTAADAAAPGASAGAPGGVAWAAPTAVSLVPGANGLAWLVAASECSPLLSLCEKAELFKNCLVYGAPALSFLLASAVLPGFTLFGGGYFLGNGWWLSLLLGAVHLQLERIRVNDCLAAAGGRTLEGMTAGGEEEEEVLSVEELEAMHRQGELESFDQRLNMRATAGGAAARLRPRDWTVGDVARWLQENGFARYAAAFLEHDVSGEVLLGLTAEELREELGMKSLGERKRFVAALESVQAEERVD